VKESWLSSNSIFIGKEKAIRKINDYAVNGTPFLFLVDFEGTHAAVLTREEATAHRIFFRIGQEHNLTEFRPLIKPETPGLFIPVPVSFEEYRHAFDNIMSHLKRGDTYLLNLTFPTEIQTTLSPEEIFHLSEAPYKLLVEDRFVVFSPESFVTIDKETIRSFPMKGTIDADIPDAGKILLADRKELFEHNTIVDLIRNDLSMISTSVRVERFRYLERIPTNRKDLLQASSEISGKLPPGHWSHLGEDLFALLPAGSVTGAPKEKTVQIIRETETYERGFYTGVFGYFNGTGLQSAVMIRFIESAGGKLWFKSGGGITALSNCESEYHELNDKVYVPFA